MAETHNLLPSEAEFTRMEGELFARLGHSQVRRAHRHRIALVAAAAVIVAGGSIAAGTVANPVQRDYLTECYHGSDTSSAYSDLVGDNVPSEVKEASAINAARLRISTESCESAWNAGVFGPKSNPTLQACIEDNLTVAVFVRPDGEDETATQFCDDLGMSYL